MKPPWLHLKGNRVKTKGIHFAAAEARLLNISAPPASKVGRSSGPRQAPHAEAVSNRAMTERTMNRLMMGYLERLPGAIHETELPDGRKGSSVRLLAAFAAGHHGHAAARFRRGD
jgi:hypothetical protein